MLPAPVPPRFLTPVLRRCAGLVATLLLTAGTSGCGTVMEKNQVRQPVEHLYTVRDPQFRRSMEALLGPSLVGGNRTTTLLNGDQIFPSMLAAIHHAKQTIDFETYIYWKGQAGDQFAQALAERARSGVKVRVILDWQGSNKISREESRLMEDAGVEIARYHALTWYDPRRVNNRTHRKLLIVDGKIGFIGGVGIADVWLGNADAPDHWRDTHFKVEGPVVAQIQADFMSNWLKTRGEVLHGDAVLPPPGPGRRRGGAIVPQFAGLRLSRHALHVPAFGRFAGQSIISRPPTSFPTTFS